MESKQCSKCNKVIEGNLVNFDSQSYHSSCYKEVSDAKSGRSTPVLLRSWKKQLNQYKDSGKLNIRKTELPVQIEPIYFILSVSSATLKSEEQYLPHPYVEIFVRKQDGTAGAPVRSSTVHSSLEPVWDFTAKFPIKAHYKEIVCEIWDDHHKRRHFGHHVISELKNLPTRFDGPQKLKHSETHVELENEITLSWRIISESDPTYGQHVKKQMSQFGGRHITGTGPKKTDRIVILGAGPAGIHMAYELKRRGFSHITILEREDRVGGKSYTLPDDRNPQIVHEMGTCFLHPLYFELDKILKELELEEYAPGDHLTNDRDIFVPEDVPKFGWKSKVPVGREAYVLSHGTEKVSGLAKPDVLMKGAFFQAMKRYKVIHRKLFGHYHWTMPPKPPARLIQKLDMTLKEFLHEHHIEALIPLFELGHSAQGYGIVDHVPAFSIMVVSSRIILGLSSCTCR